MFSIGYADGVSKPFFVATTSRKPPRTADADVVAARCLVYELFDATEGLPGAWHVLEKVTEERQATVTKALERGGIIIRDIGSGKKKVVSVSLTSEGRLLARKR